MEPNYRRCISCRRVAPKQAFWRIVRVYPSRQVELDRGEGRSAYLCPTQSCLQAAQKKNRLGNALKTAVPPEIYQALWQHLSNHQASINSKPRERIASDSEPDAGQNCTRCHSGFHRGTANPNSAEQQGECQNSK
ncbi:YlxR family protein [Planktothrix sp. FACHB-1355]|uniref:YlxR family protein n=1 Tax=Aerosakkonema funiforme FACHB-1375 TaxID=2949571 RepID=A0A926ZGI4_9CYAN|nr:DUF448 domain-containing protein [Aerosakkonema funiforme]MBD2182273.1 YlxR family protein [Aerosakkonema funiforme FACHB-1375]MBD3559468.1 YlxR family protein [Planktothrix sp. FACHB-1355]